ncbi:MAG: nucleoside recognition domain-containing protein, partial [Candidatus Poribacteria bacterium]
MSVIIRYDEALESALEQIGNHLHSDYRVSKRMIGLMLLQNDQEIHKLVKENEGEEYEAIKKIIDNVRSKYSHSLGYVITMARQSQVQEILDDVVTVSEKQRERFPERLSRMMMNPLTGVPLLILALIFMYYSVGVFGAGILVDLLEGKFFGDAENGLIVPYITRFTERIIPWAFLQDLFVHEYGIITLGIRYAIAIVFPIVGIFFIVFSIIEDTGYLPRLAMLVDRIFKFIGLNGRAVIPIVLG